VSVIGSGGMSLAGSTTTERKVQSAASGGVALGGIAGLVRRVQPGAAGGISTAGAAVAAVGVSATASGGIALVGASTPQRGAHPVAAGGAIFAGAALAEFSGPSSVSVVGLGGMALGATAIYVRHVGWMPLGGVVLGGNGDVSVHTSAAFAVGSGGIALVGMAESGFFSTTGSGARQRTLVGCGV